MVSTKLVALWPFWMTENQFRSHFSPFQINTQLLFFLTFFHKMVAGGHFGWPKITFDRISRYFRSIRNFYIFWYFFHKMKITFDNISLHFRSIRNFNFFLNGFTKWSPAAILDDRKSLSIVFLSISDQYATFFFKFVHTPAAILDDRKWLSIAFLAISDQYATFFFKFCRKMAAGVHFGWSKITFDRISRHFR